MRSVGSITTLDLDALSAVKRAGFVGVDVKGEPYLESDTQISPWRFARLIAHEFLISSEDGLLNGYPQTYRVSPGAP